MKLFLEDSRLELIDGRKSVCSMMRKILCLVSSLTVPLPLMTKETVVGETPAILATSLIVKLKNHSPFKTYIGTIIHQILNGRNNTAANSCTELAIAAANLRRLRCISF